jgi:hypothetical protein
MYMSAWINLLGLYGGVDMSVSKWGISGKGKLPKIDKPWFRLTAVEHPENVQHIPPSETPLGMTPAEAQEIRNGLKTQAVGTSDFPPLETSPNKPTVPDEEKPHDGPSFYLDLNLLKQRAFLNGNLEIPPLSIKQEVDVDISLSGAKCRLTNKLFGVYECELELAITKEDAHIKARMAQSALRLFESIMADAARDMVKASERDIAKAKKDVERAMGDLNALKNRIDQSKDKCVK